MLVSKNKMDDHKLGTLYGVYLGDAMGAVLEFQYVDSRICKHRVRWAMTLPGDSCMFLRPGQTTDDSDLTRILHEAFLGAKPFCLDRLAASYHAWLQSNPPDVGRTIRTAFGTSAPTAKAMWRRAREMNMDAQTNGALMRVAPIAIHATDDLDAMIRLIRRECRLSHPNPICIDCNVLYCIAIWCLIRHRDPIPLIEQQYVATVHPEVQDWFLRLSLPHVGIRSSFPNEGHVKYGFVHAFYHLRKKSTFEAAIEATLRTGGDTDTNAAIVGGMMGALHGYRALPQERLALLMKANTSCT